MATQAELDKLKQLVGKQLPVGDAAAEDYTELQLRSLLAAVPTCPLSSGSGADVYAAAAMAWDDKALMAELTSTEAGGGAVEVTSVRQGDASVTYARPTALGATALGPNDPAAMRALASRLRRRSCNGGRFRSVDVAPPNVVTPGDRGARERLEWDGGDALYGAGRPAILDPVNNPDRVRNLPEVD